MRSRHLSNATESPARGSARLGYCSHATLPRRVRDRRSARHRDPYSGFAFIVAALLLERPERLPLIISFLRVVGSTAILAAPILQMARFISYGPEAMYIVSFHPADVAGCHLAGAALLMLLGFKRAGIGWLILMLIGMAIVSDLVQQPRATPREFGTLVRFAGKGGKEDLQAAASWSDNR